jgi:hypothetical protein
MNKIINHIKGILFDIVMLAILALLVISYVIFRAQCFFERK